MKHFFFIWLIILLALKAQSQISWHDWQRPRLRFCSNPTFNVSEIRTIAGNYADAPNNTDSSFNFKIYFPDTTKDNLSKRPFILLIHGGEYEVGSLSFNENISTQLAERGFVAATINYRLSNWQTGNCLSSDTLSLWQNYYRSIQDTRAALRYFVHHAADFRIDTSWLFIGGQSSGAITSLAVAFQDQQETDAVTGPLNLGDIDHADNSFADHFTIKGVLNQFGAIKHTSDIDAFENIPVISMHAQNDPFVPYDSNHLAWGQCGNTYQLVNGSGEIQQRLLSLGICSELDYSPHAQHVNLVTDDYVVRHVSCFFKSLMNSTCKPDTFTIEDNLKPNCCLLTLNFPLDHRTFRAGQNESSAKFFYSNQQLLIELEEGDGNYSADVIDVCGRKIAEFNRLVAGENIFSIELLPGIYFVSVKNETATIATRKFVVADQ